jgi:hypothetical protein
MLAPENTILAARLAYRTDSEAWEFDVRLTRDGSLHSVQRSSFSSCQSCGNLTEIVVPKLAVTDKFRIDRSGIGGNKGGYVP